MIGKRIAIGLALVSSTFCPAFELNQEDRAEIASSWKARWNEQLAPERGQSDMHRYADELLKIDGIDVQVAEQIVIHLCQGEEWDYFVQTRDLDGMAPFFYHMVTVLRQIIWAESEMSFPVMLVDIAEDIKRSGMQETDYLARLRQTNLAFTIILASMNYISDGALQ